MMIELESVTKIYRMGAVEVHALAGVSLTIDQGEMVAVMGASGSGKSTLVHDVLYAAIKRAKGRWDKRVGTHTGLEGLEFLADVVLVVQAPGFLELRSPQIQVPAIVLRGAESGFGRPSANPAGDQQRFPSLVARHIVEGAGHNLPAHRPDAVSLALLELLA